MTLKAIKMNKLKPHATIMHKKILKLFRHNEMISFMNAHIGGEPWTETRSRSSHSSGQCCSWESGGRCDGGDSWGVAKGDKTVLFLDQAGNYTSFSFKIIF